MNRRILSILVIIMLGLALFPFPAAAAEAAAADAAYAGGVVTVDGEGFEGGDAYIVRVVNTVEDHIAAMEQTTADESGKLSASVTTGALGKLSDYTVYVNNLDGSLAAQDSTIENGTLYRVIYNGNGSTGGAVPTDGKSYKENDTATILGNTNGLTKAGYSFSGWTRNSDGSGTVYSQGSTLTVGAADVMLYARWTASPPTGGGNNPNTGNEGSSGSSGTPAVKDDGKTATVSVTVKAVADASGRLTATVTPEQGAALLASAKTAESDGKKAVVEIKVEAPAEAKAAKIVVTRNIFDKIADETDAALKLDAGMCSVTFDEKATAGISDAAAKGDIGLEITKVDATGFDENVRNMVGDRPVYDFTLTAGGSPISSFGAGSADISIPYVLRPGEDANAIVVYYIDSSMEMQIVSGAYHAAAGKVDFRVTHFSTYAVGYNKVSFSDVGAGDWYYPAVTFIAARGITMGTTETTYGPDDKLTRGQFIVMLMKAYDLEPGENTADNFTDAGNTYYTGYLAAAKRLGLSSGTGNNRFSPDAEITRQEMFTLLYNILNFVGAAPEGVSGKTLSGFTDSGKLASWAKDAVESLVQTGKVSGSGGRINPLDKASRADMAQTLYSLLSK